MTKNNAFGGEKQNKKSNGEQSDLCDLEQVTLKPQLQVHHYLTTWLQVWYHSLLWGGSIRKGAHLEKQNCLFGVHHAVMGKLTSLHSLQCIWAFLCVLLFDLSHHRAFDIFRPHRFLCVWGGKSYPVFNFF